MTLSIVVPCYNEEKVLRAFYSKTSLEIHKLTTDYEFVFVNDGSKDDTLNILRDLASADSSVHYISFSRNFGKEAAMLAGLKYATGDAIVIMDADLQHPPTLIKELLEGYNDGYDQVIAKRTRTGDSPVRSFVSRLYYKVMNKFVDIELVDGIGDFRLLSRRAVDSLLSLSEYNRFSKGLFSWIGYNELIIEYENVLRSDGESKWTFSKLLNYGIDGVISFNNKPLRLSIYLGLLTTILGLLYVITTFVQIILGGVEVPGYFTLISAILFIGGIQLIFLGVIGEYIGRIYYETKRRPHFIVAEKKVSEVKQKA
ncbi:glycosyltransferase [Bacillus thuringiensis serovar subtoxicus]|uniref:Glycosyltransferase n=1 Tax=Bacillus thuringiensis serovar subtoxicus TaxID=475791 RepID=A0A9X6IKQ0_BACTU|nr:glycosyltransferase family 2 protein [Bacillus thuringiensis]MEB8584143.1 glycosyltransferase family 2 protein [Bacillus cereus]MDR4282653.1 glycosyltransferase family 2 protein [Bacillus thuringiensis]MEB8596717.1 glycosyltransferase family 2 protein [Bacillus cereus]MEB8610879.1 glycosyltransferase family 2 protein [Bacillus cereus]MEB8620938.1 glycosyltransferase family 2 protein [Bacillus cereus]